MQPKTTRTTPTLPIPDCDNSDETDEKERQGEATLLTTTTRTRTADNLANRSAPRLNHRPANNIRQRNLHPNERRHDNTCDACRS
jgi:hypothetical protein